MKDSSMHLAAINIMKGLAYSQLELQDLRAQLLERGQFNDQDIYRQIDRKMTDKINPQDLINFLSVHRIATNERQCQYLIWLAGSNEPYLTHAQFVYYLSNGRDYSPQMQSSGIGSRLMPVDAVMKNTAQRQVAKLFEKEIEYYRAIEQLREEFVKSYGYSFNNVVQAIDHYHRGNIPLETLVTFIQQAGIDFSREEFQALAKKVRARETTVLSYKELLRALSPFEPLNFPTYRKQSNLQKAMDYITQQVQLLDIDTSIPFQATDQKKTRTGFERVLQEFRNPMTQGGHLSSNYFYDKNYYNELRQYRTTYFEPNKEVKKKYQREMVGPQYHDHFFGDYYLHLQERNKIEHYYNKFGKRYAFENHIAKTFDQKA